MVLAEIPLWVSHGNLSSSDNNGTRTLPGMGGMKSNNDTISNTSQQSLDQSAAKSALSLLSSTRTGSGRAPMYSIDVHPDGTRFATAAGDGTVKIWSMSTLFDGVLNDTNNNSNSKKRSKGGKQSKKKKGPTSKFTEGGNYVSSQSEDYESSSSEDTPKKQSAAQQQQQKPPGTPQAAVNDLSSLVRKKKDGTPQKSTAAVNPFTTSTNFMDRSNNNESASMSPLSRLTSRPGGASIATQPSNKQHKLLSTISSHEGSVLALRFSSSGTYLATAGDDSYVNIYQRSNTPSLAKGNLVGVGADGSKSTSNGTNNDEDVEHWNRIAICRGHHLDVVGLTWAPDDSHLVTCSLDSGNPIIVWRLFDVLNSDSTEGNNSSSQVRPLGFSGSNSSSVHVHNLHPFKVLGRDTHTSTVKGVSFDPAGKYVASSGDDPAICIWRAFDDWGLEARIDSSSGIFRSKKRKRGSGGNSPRVDEIEEDDPGELASLSLFRRISFAPDGTHVCGTNASLRGKNIAACIARDGWAASGPRDGKDGESRSGGANLVGHKQPVVASRHCPVFFSLPNEDSDSDDPDEVSDYATLVALGDKRGFVTIWSTKATRPLFKMQCSESKCTVTDISWGVARRPTGEDSLVLFVSLLDGYIVALHFSVPSEVGGGSILSSEKTRSIFRLKYGIDDFVGSYCFSPGKKQRRPKRLVDDAGPMLLENPLQLTMEMEAEANKGEESGESNKVAPDKEGAPSNQTQAAATEGAANNSGNIKDKQMETSKGGKKRIRPVLMSVGGGAVTNIFDEDAQSGSDKRQKTSNDSSSDPLQNAMNANSNGSTGGSGGNHPTPSSSETHYATAPNNIVGSAVKIPFSTSKILSVELTSKSSTSSSILTPQDNNSNKIIADCTNSTTGGVPSFALTISRGGTKQWKDIIIRSKATALTANQQLMAVGTSDGCLYLFGTSPTLGWTSFKAYRAFPPFILGSPVVEISISNSSSSTDEDNDTSCEIVVVTSDGSFAVYTISSGTPKLNYKGSVVPAMQHMHLSFNHQQRSNSSAVQPTMARIQITDSNQLMLILVLPLKSSGGRSLQGFVYNRDMELWMRVCDSNNFVMSDFYSSLAPQAQPSDSDKVGILAKMDGIIKSSAPSMASAKQMYQKLASSSDNSSNTSPQQIITRSHCEDRLACSIALGSASEFQTWMRYYARCLVTSGDGDALRFLVDILLDDQTAMVDDTPGIQSFLSVGKSTLGFEGKDLVSKYILPEMSKNRLLQRLTNEISIELA